MKRPIREYYVHVCPDTGRQFLCQVGKDGNVIELTPANIRKIKEISK